MKRLTSSGDDSGNRRTLGGETRRELEEQAEDAHMAEMISDRWDDKHLG